MRNEFWYRILDYGSGKQGFQFIVSRDYIEQKKGEVDFERLQRDISGIVVDGLNLDLEITKHSESNLFRSINSISSRFGLDYNEENPNYNPEKEIAFSTHNCNSSVQRVCLERAVLMWTREIEILENT